MIQVNKCLKFDFIKIAFCLSCLLIHFFSVAQTRTDKIPLHLLFQEHYDSTIVYQQGSIRGTPDYFIIAKKDTLISSFRYTRPYPVLYGRQYPSVLTNKFIMDNIKYEQVTPDTNQYFRIYETSLNNRQEGWKHINAFSIWKLESSMPDTLADCQIYDGAYDTYFLITKDKIKVLEYYEAAFFEDCHGTNSNRRNEIQTRKAIFQFFQYNNRSLNTKL